MAKTAEKRAIIKPTIDFGDNKKHAMEKLLHGEEESLPTLKAVGVTKVLLPNQTQAWTSYTVHFRGNNVVQVDVDEPNMAQIAVEQAKMNFVHIFMKDEF